MNAQQAYWANNGCNGKAYQEASHKETCLHLFLLQAIAPFNAIKKVAKPSMRGLATGDICFFLLGSGRHAKRTKPPIGLVGLLILNQYLQELKALSHWYTPCYPFSSVLSNEMSS